MPSEGRELTAAEVNLNAACEQRKIQHILHEFHSERDAQVAQHGHPFINDLPDDRDELIQLGARVTQAVLMLDMERIGA